MKETRFPDPRLHFREPLRQTPFHARTAPLNRLNAWGPWAGYTTALAFDDEAMEYTAIRNQASVYDLSPMVKYRIGGPDALAYLNRLMLRDAAKLGVGRVHYTAWCDDDGKLLDDGTLFRLGEAEYLLCCQERHLPWLLDSAIGFDAQVAEVTEDIAALSLQGPTAFAVLREAGFGAASALKPFQLTAFPWGAGRLTISRTGFTGDLVTATDLLTPSDLAERYGLVGGDWHHGELAVERMLILRPTIGTAQYAAPIPGLWLAGAGSHPGGGVSGAAGWNAAERLLATEGRS
jgi:aminomethyltransferase